MQDQDTFQRDEHEQHQASLSHNILTMNQPVFARAVYAARLEQG